jgi:sugar O-acyltransferase (sialic acid O-acetyltransferase NeuD family)
MAQRLSHCQNELVLIGGGSLALEVLCFIKDINSHDPRNLFNVAYVIDAKGGRAADLTQIEPRLKIVKSVDEIPCPGKYAASICVGDAVLRWQLYRELNKTFARWKSIIHPTARIMASAHIGDGAIIAPHAYVGPLAKIGVNSLINVGVSIGHDANIGHSAVISPQVAINGFASCGEATFIGAAATLLPSASLGSQCKLSAGSVFGGSVTNGFLLHGNPAKGRQMFGVK